MLTLNIMTHFLQLYLQILVNKIKFEKEQIKEN